MLTKEEKELLIRSLDSIREVFCLLLIKIPINSFIDGIDALKTDVNNNKILKNNYALFILEKMHSFCLDGGKIIPSLDLTRDKIGNIIKFLILKSENRGSNN